ncbi:hypothetical protein [uncultured Bacteroides sp.]|uniref:hypothetical protein n=1 Tax=uncultured Bacteroides sp. TaxID=162156 RepID=UPI00262DCB67|nr:hypothetical protein [uncultured Bacteroides sp.]
MTSTTARKQVAIFIAGFAAFFIALGIVGKMDYQEAVINSISCEAYAEIVEKVGNDTDDIISEYNMHRDYYDSLSY